MLPLKMGKEGRGINKRGSCELTTSSPYPITSFETAFFYTRPTAAVLFGRCWRLSTPYAIFISFTASGSISFPSSLSYPVKPISLLITNSSFNILMVKG